MLPAQNPRTPCLTRILKHPKGKWRTRTYGVRGEFLESRFSRTLKDRRQSLRLGIAEPPPFTQRRHKRIEIATAFCKRFAMTHYLVVVRNDNGSKFGMTMGRDCSARVVSHFDCFV